MDCALLKITSINERQLKFLLSRSVIEPNSAYNMLQLNKSPVAWGKVCWNRPFPTTTGSPDPNPFTRRSRRDAYYSIVPLKRAFWQVFLLQFQTKLFIPTLIYKMLGRSDWRDGSASTLPGGTGMTHSAIKNELELCLFVKSEIDDYGLDPYEFRLYARIGLWIK